LLARPAEFAIERTRAHATRSLRRSEYWSDQYTPCYIVIVEIASGGQKMAESNLVICYEGIQRVYRNAVVKLLRERLTRAFPQEFQERLRKPFEKEWEKIKQSAAERRQSGELGAQVIDEFDLLGVNHFFNLFDSYYETLLPPDPKTDENQRKVNKQAVLHWVKHIKGLRDPLSHPSERDFSFEDSFVLLDCARRVLERLNLEAESQRLRALTDNLLGRSLTTQSKSEPLEDRLPPRESIVVDFVGREKERKLLWDWFRDSVSRRWALAGEGGKGKSAIAFNFATEVKFTAPEPFQIVLWLSAKKRRFEEGMTTGIEQPDFTDLDSALSRVLAQYGWIDELEFPIERKRSRVLDLLDSFPAFIVVDDIDSLEGQDEDAIEFFTFSVPQTKSKVLLTSRRVVFGLGNVTTHIGGFGEKDAERFIFSRCRLMEIDPSVFTKSLITEIIKITEASPLYIEDLLRLTATVPPNEAIRAWKDKAGDEARLYALGREVELLSNKAREVLVATCVSPGPVSFPELEAETGLSSEQLMGALGELQRLFLVPKPRLIEGEQRFEMNLNTRALVRKQFGSSELYRRVDAAHKAISGKLPRAGRPQVAAIIRQSVFLVRNRDLPQAEQLLKTALEKYPNDPDLLAFLGWVYKAWDPPRVTDAREHFNRAWQLKGGNEEMYKHWSRMESDQREWTKAAEAAERGLKLVPDSSQLLYSAGHARSRLGRELLGGLHNERAADELGKAQDLLKRALRPPESLEYGERRLNSEIFRALVLNCELRRDVDGMEDYFARWRSEHPDDSDAETEWRRLSVKFGLE
jgi:tetratricopeptide (TPR) repeat protein